MNALLFKAVSIFVAPFWLAMVFAPNWTVTRWAMRSLVPVLIPSLAYFLLFVTSFNLGEFQNMYNLNLQDVVKLFRNEGVVAAAWVHFLTVDLFIGRWIYWEGQNSGTFVAHSLIISSIAGPVGLLSHVLTAWIRDRLSTLRSTPQAN